MNANTEAAIQRAVAKGRLEIEELQQISLEYPEALEFLRGYLDFDEHPRLEEGIVNRLVVEDRLKLLAQGVAYSDLPPVVNPPQYVLNYCRANNWTEPQKVKKSEYAFAWYAFPPNAVMPLEVPEDVEIISGALEQSARVFGQQAAKAFSLSPEELGHYIARGTVLTVCDSRGRWQPLLRGLP